MTSATNQPAASDLPKTSQPAQRALADDTQPGDQDMNN